MDYQNNRLRQNFNKGESFPSRPPYRKTTTLQTVQSLYETFLLQENVLACSHSSVFRIFMLTFLAESIIQKLF